MRRAVWGFAMVAACGGGNDVSMDAIPDAVVDIDGAVDAPPDAPAPVHLSLALERREANGPDVILLDVYVARGSMPQLGVAVGVASSNGAVSTLTETGNGHYTAEVAPTIESGDVDLVVSALGSELRRTAIVLPTVDAAWGQPELVPGPVNTPGYEDSSEISPDGQWLLVSSYSPVDLICCVAALPTICATASTAADPASVACNVSLGPHAAPDRPDLPGADRIIDGTTIHDELPRLGLDQPDGQDLPFAVPPLAAYGFKRQPDGSYGEPFSIAFEADGMTGAPFGLTFASSSGAAASIVYAWDDHRTQNAANTFNDLYRVNVTLGARVILGTFSAGVLDVEPTPVPLASHAGWQGNPGVAPDGVFFDAEQGDEDIHFAAGNALGTATLAGAVTVGVSTSGAGEFQPFFHAGRLYYSRAFQTIRSAERGNGDVSLPGTWTDDHVELGLDGSTDVGRVLAIGEPSLAVTSSGTELYFIYGQRTATGIEQSVARVRLR